MYNSGTVNQQTQKEKKLESSDITNWRKRYKPPEDKANYIPLRSRFQITLILTRCPILEGNTAYLVVVRKNNKEKEGEWIKTFENCVVVEERTEY